MPQTKSASWLAECFENVQNVNNFFAAAPLLHYVTLPSERTKFLVQKFDGVLLLSGSSSLSFGGGGGGDGGS